MALDPTECFFFFWLINPVNVFLDWERNPFSNSARSNPPSGKVCTLSGGFRLLKVKWRESPEQRAGSRNRKMACRKCIDASATLMASHPPSLPERGRTHTRAHAFTRTHTQPHTHTPHADTATLNGFLAHIPNLSALTDGRDRRAKPASLLPLRRAHLRHFVSHEFPPSPPPPLPTPPAARVRCL